MMITTNCSKCVCSAIVNSKTQFLCAVWQFGIRLSVSRECHRVLLIMLDMDTLNCGECPCFIGFFDCCC